MSFRIRWDLSQRPVNLNSMTRKTLSWFLLASEIPPCNHGGGATALVAVAVDDMALVVEMVVKGSMHRCEFLHRGHSSKTECRALASSKRLV